MAATKITVNTNGSIRVEGDFEIVDPTGAPFGLAGRTAIGLCRCGASANKPFCDGAHRKINFGSRRSPRASAASPEAARFRGSAISCEKHRSPIAPILFRSRIRADDRTRGQRLYQSGEKSA